MKTTNTRLICALATALVAACADAGGPATLPPTLTGTWTGLLVGSSAGPTGTDFTYTMELTQSGTLLSGTARLEPTAEPEYFVHFTLEGAATPEGLVQLSALEITAQNAPDGFAWCLHTATLQYSEDSQRRLIGAYSAESACAPAGGTIHLTSPK